MKQASDIINIVIWINGDGADWEQEVAVKFALMWPPTFVQQIIVHHQVSRPDWSTLRASPLLGPAKFPLWFTCIRYHMLSHKLQQSNKQYAEGIEAICVNFMNIFNKTLT